MIKVVVLAGVKNVPVESSGIAILSRAEHLSAPRLALRSA